MKGGCDSDKSSIIEVSIPYRRNERILPNEIFEYYKIVSIPYRRNESRLHGIIKSRP